MKRQISWALTLLALVVIPFGAYWMAESSIQAQRGQGGYACGMPVLALYLLAVLVAGALSLVAGALSLVATVLNVLAFRAQPAPRPVWRVLELLIVAAPLLLGVVVALMLWVNP